MKTFLLRAISGVLLVVITVGAIMFSQWSMLALALLVSVGSMTEFYKLTAFKEIVPSKLYAIFAGIGVVVLSFLVAAGIIAADYLLLLLPLFAVLFVSELYRNKKYPLENIAVSLMGVIYIAVPMALFACLGFIGTGEYGIYSYFYPLGYIVLIWVNDVGAYLVGMTIGKHRLFERVSPKKSWEGFWGGVLLTVAAGWVIGNLTQSNIHEWLLIGLVVSLSAVAGDLVESLFKRAANLKDSGSIIPGHGGFLDRFDALFISLPFVYLLLTLLNK